MRSVAMQLLVLTVCLIFVVRVAQAQTPKPLAGVKTVQVDPTVVPKADKVKEEYAANQVADILRNALKNSNFEIAEAAIRAHIVLNEFTSGSRAKLMIGFGAGRSTVDCGLVIEDSQGKELANRRIRVRGNPVSSPHQDNQTQLQQTVSSFERRLLEEIEKMK